MLVISTHVTNLWQVNLVEVSFKIPDGCTKGEKTNCPYHLSIYWLLLLQQRWQLVLNQDDESVW